MLEIIANNPFRVLGVYSNSRQAEIVHNLSKIKAYLNVNKAIEYPSDLNGLLPELKRTPELIQNAQSAINLPNDKIKYALFWFCKGDSIDETGLNNLIAQDSEKAMSIFSKRNSYSSLINRAVLSMIKSDYVNAVCSYLQIIHDYTLRGQFCVDICDETFNINEDTLAGVLFDELLKEIKPVSLLQLVNNENDKAYVRQKAVQEPISIIYSAIEKAKKVKPDDAPASLRAGKALISSTKAAIANLKSIVGVGDPQYQSVVDKLANQILQCGINYYNGTDDENYIDNALFIQEYALQIAVGKITRDRCQENVKILRERKEHSAYKKDLDFIAAQLNDFRRSNPSIINALTLVVQCKPHLSVIKNNRGANDDFYLKISSAVANNALGAIIDVVNEEQKKDPTKINYDNPYARLSSLSSYEDPIMKRFRFISSLSKTIDTAVNAMAVIGELDMTQQERDHFASNYRTLKNIQTQLKTATNNMLPTSNSTRSYSSSSSSSSGGCYIATMVYGDYDEPHVLVLRHFRDTVLSNYALGRRFIRFYYRYSPTWVEHLKDKKRINSIIRSILDKFIYIYTHEKN